jgi:hypothetical protein
VFELLRQIVKASRERCEVSERVHRELSLSADTVVHVREVQCSESVETIITVLEPDNIRKYSIAKASADITGSELRGLLIAPLETGSEAPDMI